MLPGCMSAWKKPSRNTWVKQISTPARASALRSMPFSRSSEIWEMGTPCMRSITMTRSEHKSQCTSGIASSAELRKLRRSWLALAASVKRFSSSSRCRANSATTSRGLRRRPSGESRSTSDAAVCRSAKSFAISRSTPGRSTLTATSRASLSRPMCTWAIEALYRCAQPLEPSGEILELGAPHEGAAFGGGVIGQRLAYALRRVELPAPEGTHGAGDALGGDVADDPGELLLGFPAQVLGEVA